jgi:hypothetical protein
MNGLKRPALGGLDDLDASHRDELAAGARDFLDFYEKRQSHQHGQQRHNGDNQVAHRARDAVIIDVAAELCHRAAVPRD